jgi:transportin-1
MSFQVNGAFMASVMKLLQLSGNTSREAQAQVLQGQEQLARHPEWMTHLCAVLIANNSQCDRYHRQLAGIMLKNFVKRQYGTTTPEAREALRQMILRALGDEHVPVRRTAGLVILSVVQKEEGFDKWPGLLQGLVQALDAAAQPALQDGALYCVGLLCEDATRELEDCAQRPLNALVPLLVRLMGGAAGDVPRLRALRALNAFVVDWPNAMKVNSAAFLEAVFACANSADAEVCREVCRTFNTLCDVKVNEVVVGCSFSHPVVSQPDLVGPYIQSVASFMLAQSGKRREPELQCEAMEFWQVLAEQVMWHEALRAKVQLLLPLLLDGIVYDADDVEALMELDDAAVPLAEKHVAPWFAKGRSAKGKDEDGAEDKARACRK